MYRLFTSKNLANFGNARLMTWLQRKVCEVVQCWSNWGGGEDCGGSRQPGRLPLTPHLHTFLQLQLAFNLPHFSSKGLCSLPQGQIVYLDLNINTLLLPIYNFMLLWRTLFDSQIEFISDFFLGVQKPNFIWYFFVGLPLCAEAVNPAQALKSSEETQHSFKGGVQKICGPSTGKSYTTHIDW